MSSLPAPARLRERFDDKDLGSSCQRKNIDKSTILWYNTARTIADTKKTSPLLAVRHLRLQLAIPELWTSFYVLRNQVNS